jgi:2-oxoglutarate ferredoxin oxidoreductase subunit alpha
MEWLSAKFAKKPEVFQANQRAIEAGYRYGDSSEMVSAIALLGRYRIARARVVPGRYRQVSGHEAIALALITAATRSRRRLVYAAAPLTHSRGTAAPSGRTPTMGWLYLSG